MLSDGTRAWGLKEHDQLELPLGAARMLLGGRVPHGAVIVEVRDHAGVWHHAAVADDVWSVQLSQPCLRRRLKVPVRYLNSAGRHVNYALPADLKREPIADASDPCPVCEFVTWDRLTGDTGDPHSVHGGAAVWVCCRTCGFNERSGVIRLHAAAPTAASHSDQGAERISRVAREARFPIYVARGYNARLERRYRAAAATTAVTISHFDSSSSNEPIVTVQTNAGSGRKRSPEDAEAWQLLSTLGQTLARTVHRPGMTARSLSDGASVIASRARRRGTACRAARGASLILNVIVDEEHRTFSGLIAEGGWVVRYHDAEISIVLSGTRNPGAFQLRQVNTPNRSKGDL